MNEEKILNQEQENEASECVGTVEENNKDENSEAENTMGHKNKELEELKKQFEEKSAQCDNYLGMLQRTAAEFDNYKKRTAKEKESLYQEAVSDAVAAFLPVVDNLERALTVSASNGEGQSIREGVELVFKQIKDVLKNLGVEEIKGTSGEKFDPNLHHAVMHIEDDAYGDNEIVEEFQKGYIIKDKVIRHSMVKVAN